MDTNQFKIIWASLRWVKCTIELCCALIGVITLGFYRPWWDFKFIATVSKVKCAYQAAKEQQANKAWRGLKNGQVVYLRVNPEVVAKGYLALVVRWEDGFPFGNETGDYMNYRLDKWFHRIEFTKPEGCDVKSDF